MLSYWSKPQEVVDIPPAPAGFMWPYECEQWRKEQLKGLSHEDVFELRARLDELDQEKGHIVANAWLVEVVERYQLLNKISVMRPYVQKEAERLAKRSRQDSIEWLRGVVARLRFCDKMISELDGAELSKWAETKRYEFESGMYGLLVNEGRAAVLKWVEVHLKEVGVSFRDWDDEDKVVAMIARMITPEWWARQAKKQWRVVESILRECGEVHNGASPYLSKWGLNKFRKQQKANAEFLKGWEAVNQNDEAFTLEDLSSRGVSNPFIRRGELMARVRGTEELAVEMEHVGYFLTLTCPSKYHAVRKNGRRVGKFYKAKCPDPRRGQTYLCNVFKRIRSKCKRDGVHFYGVRVVEPHHDATPHWHMMVFGEAAQLKTFLAIFKHYALQEDGHEKGAEEKRYDIKYMDPAQGTAAGYMAKYVCKSVDGEHIEKDIETGRNASAMSESITGWARRFGIRQFQFFGGVSVSVWRELRKIKKDVGAVIKPIHEAADKGRWKDFTKLMGGVFAGRNQTLKLHYSEEEENQYGELVSSIKGVARGVDVYVTRFYDWTIQRVGSGSESSSLKNGGAVPWTRVNKCTGPSFGLRNQPTGSGGGGANVSTG
ncbi:replication endonuclease [Marinomonas sp. RSW2]|uniref:Replication endonuclease n=1 Tax=Marinomonas maritima TaxID=2940935 RepID=A0ABT5WGI7_9GAMM|nr:replication endonuclease [Marinomonas maritima]MDE8603921.1 replication endonuclease [Marinomonas maritima]